jgi:hypothetical protein
MTLGPIADSAMWGGKFDILVRGLVNGLFLAGIARCLIYCQYHWWRLVVYTYCCSTSIVALKYAVFWVITPWTKMIIPAILVFRLVSFLKLSKLIKR